MAKCPYFLSMTNGKKLYINCSKTGHMKDAERLEFDEAWVRRSYYKHKCLDAFQICPMYKDLSNRKE